MGSSWEHERMQNLRGAVELLAGASTACRMVLFHHGHRLRVHRLPHRARSDQNPGVNPKMQIRRAGRGDSPVPRGRARAPRRPPRAPAAAAGSDKQRRARGRRGSGAGAVGGAERARSATYLEEVGVRGVGEEGRVGGEVVPLELLHQVRHLRRRRREGRCRGGLRHRGRGGRRRREVIARLAFELGFGEEGVVAWHLADRAIAVG